MHSDETPFLLIPDMVIAPGLAILIAATFIMGLIVLRTLRDHFRFAYMPLVSVWAFICLLSHLAVIPFPEAFWSLILPMILFVVPIAAGRFALTLLIILLGAAFLLQIVYMPEMPLPGPHWDITAALDKALDLQIKTSLHLSLPLLAWVCLVSVSAICVFNVQTPKIKNGISGKYHLQTGLLMTGLSFILTLMAYSVHAAQVTLQQEINWVLLIEHACLTACLTFGGWRLLCLEMGRLKQIEMASAQMASFIKNPQACVIIGPNGNIRAANPAVTSLLGFSNDQLLRRNIRDLEYNAGHSEASYKNLLKSGFWPRHLAGHYLRKDSVGQMCNLFADQIETSAGTAIMVCLSAKESKQTVLDVVTEVATSTDMPVSEEVLQTADNKSFMSEQRDPVTGLKLKGAMLQLAFPLAQKVAQEQLDNVTLVIAKLEDFEDWAAKRGAAMGKALLQGYARTLSQTLRPEDKVFYVGDYRFGVVMPGRGEGATPLLRKRFKEVVNLTHHAGFEGVTTQIGFAAVSEADYDVSKTFDLAEQRSQDRRWSRI